MQTSKSQHHRLSCQVMLMILLTLAASAQSRVTDITVSEDTIYQDNGNDNDVSNNNGSSNGDSKYSWKTGWWGVCWSEKGCGPGIEERTVWCADTLSRTVPPGLCPLHDKPPDTRLCYTTCQGGTWQPGPWSECLVEGSQSRSRPGEICHGTQYRNVSCLTQMSSNVPPLPCSGPEPARESPCSTECPLDCLVGPWGEWTPCSVCGKLQTRNRAVLAPPGKGGKQCSRLTEGRVCEEDCQAPTSSTTSTTPEPVRPWLFVGRWGECQVSAPGQRLLISRKGKESDFVIEDVFGGDAGLKTETSVVEEDEMEEEEETSGDGKGGRDQDPVASITTTTIRPEEKSDDGEEPYTGILLERADFFVENLTDDTVAQIGTQTRNLSCYSGVDHELPLGLCQVELGALPPVRRPCVVPRDCHVTQWTPWATVTQGCVAPSGQVVREVRERRRSALLLHQGAGAPCPHLLETHTLPRPRLVPCDAKYEWVPSSWGPCVSTVGPDTLAPVSCGGGVQKRRVFCTRAQDRVPVVDALCAHTQPPPIYQRCEVGCERDCQLGPWSAWGACTPPDCSLMPPPAAPGYRRRRREVLVTPSAGGRECSPLEQQSECHGAQCHQWVTGEWQPCALDSLSHHCGPGRMRRNITCLDAFGRPSPSEECERELGEMTSQKECHVSCPFDCVLATWSEWSPCSRPCSSDQQVGYTRRNTTIAAPAGPGGRPCPAPDELTEVSTCRLEPCGGAAWHPTPWSRCHPDADAVCGPGTQTRALRCVGPDGASLSLHRCRGLQQPSQERPCEVECGASCSVSPWSEWSECRSPHPCPHGVVSSVQRRYREVLLAPWGVGAPCPPLSQERACAVAPQSCPGPHWQPGPWGHCRLNPGARCGEGLRVRAVTCTDLLGSRLEPTLCLLRNTVVPDSSEPCTVLCREGHEGRCALTPWTEWSPCPQQAPCSQASSERTQELIDDSEADPVCLNLTLKETVPCPCHSHYSSPASDWSQCIVGGHHARPNGVVKFTFGISSIQDSAGSGPKWDGGFSSMASDTATSSEDPDYVPHPQLKNAKDDRRFAEYEGTPDSYGGDTADGAVSTNNYFEDYPKNDVASSGYEYTNSEGGGILRTDGTYTLVGSISGLYFSKDQPSVSAASPEMLWSSREQMEREIKEELSNEISLLGMDAPPSPTDDRDRDGSDQDSDLQRKGVCGVGVRYRSVSCVRDDDVIVHPRACGHQGVEWEPCMLECPVDCRVGAWGPWTACNSSCGPGLQTRTREVVSPQLWGGRACPEVMQTRACWGGCGGVWAASGWGECLGLGGTPLTECDTGTQTRTVRCERETPDGLREEAPNGECQGRPAPAITQPCALACPGACVVASWAPWTQCSPGCALHSTRSRSRPVLRQPVILTTAPATPQQLQQQCPALRQEEPCLAGFSCWWYTWQVGNWTSCVPLGQSSCGEGIMNRPVACLRSDGVKVEDSLCGEDGKPTPRETWCYVDCPIDCEVTSWTDWDTSHCSCGDTAGNMTRQRFIAVNPSDSGRACPMDLDQQRPCPSLPCYTWERGPWGHCKLEGGSCGHGTVERVVSCVGAGGERVPPSLCLQLFHVGGHTWPFLAHALDLNTKDSCFVSCSGGCELTEWSSWSHCHRDCGSGQAGGRQSRRRGILSPGSSGPSSCPHDLQQSRGCLAAPCRSYAWQFRASKAVCVRDDGVVVTVGCDEKQKPCYPGCAVPHSRCSVQGWCVCKPGHRALYSESQRYSLMQCVPDPALNSSVYAALPLAQMMMQSKMVPEQINVWMFAMIGVGTAFIIFVAISMYLLCSHGTREQTSFPLVSRSHTSTIRGQHHRFNTPLPANIIANPQQPDDEQMQQKPYQRQLDQQQHKVDGLVTGKGVVELQQPSTARQGGQQSLDADSGSVGSLPDTGHNVTASSHLDLET